MRCCARAGDSDGRCRGCRLDLRVRERPPHQNGTAPDGQSIDIVDTTKLAELSRALKKDDLADYVKKYPKG